MFHCNCDADDDFVSEVEHNTGGGVVGFLCALDYYRMPQTFLCHSLAGHLTTQKCSGYCEAFNSEMIVVIATCSVPYAVLFVAF